MAEKTVDVIIPVYEPDEKFDLLLDGLSEQTILPTKVIFPVTVRDDEDDALSKQQNKAAEYSRKTGIDTLVFPVPFCEFDHALTREKAAFMSEADCVLFMTQDCVPADRFLIKKLLSSLNGAVSAAYARQIAYDNASYTEKLLREFNYPAASHIMCKEDIKRFGVKAFFASDVCMMYDLRVFKELGGFGTSSVFGEDMLYVHRLYTADKSVAYNAEAMVYHSHDYPLKTVFKRSFDTGVNQADHPEIFENVSSEKEGVRLVWFISGRLLKKFKIYSQIKFCIDCFVKYIGFRLGRAYHRLSPRKVMKYTMNRSYFERYYEKLSREGN